MPLSTVTLKWAITDLIQSGLSATLSILPTAQLSDTADHILVSGVTPRTYRFTGGTGQLAGIVANDDENILPAGTGYLISVTADGGVVIVPQFQTQLLTADAVDGVLWLDALATVPSVTTTYQYLPRTTGTPVEGNVPVFTGDGYATTPGAVMANPMSAVGDTIYGGASGAAERLPPNTSATRKFWRQQGTGSAGAAPVWDTLESGDLPALPSALIGLAPTGDETGADDLANIQGLLNIVGWAALQPGEFYTDGKLNFQAGNTLTGAGCGLYTGGTPTATSTVINCLSATAHGIAGVDLGGVTIRGLALAGPGSGSVDGINFTWSDYGNTPFVTLDDIMVYGFGRDGISIQTPLSLSMRRVMARANGRDNYSLYGNGTTITAGSCWSEGGGRYGWNVTNCNYSQFAGCAAQSDTTTGWYLNGCESVGLAACGAESQLLDSVVITNCNSVKVSGLWIYQNNRYGVHVTGTSYRISLNSVFEVSPAGGAVNSILTDSGSVVTLTDCGGVVTPVSLNSGAYQVQIDGGAVTAGGPVTGLTVTATGLPGATGAGRWAGVSFGGAPTTGTFAAGDWVPDRFNGCLWFCTVAGTPGTWVRTGNMLAANNLSDLASASTARANLGLGSAATQSSAAFDAAGLAAAAQTAAEAASLSLASGGTVAGATAFTSTVTAQTPTQASQVAIKSYVDSVAAGLDAKPSVTALAASNITLSGTQTIDGVAVTAGQRVLCAGQSTASQNGLWVVASGSWARPADFASASTQLGAFAFVEAGTANSSSGWVLVGASAVTVDTSAQTWTQFSGAGEVNAGTGLSKTGNTLSLTTPVAAGNLPAATTSAQGAVIIDGTATDIQPAGTQAAGSNGKAADSGHVHPETSSWTPGDYGLIGWSWDLSMADNAGTYNNGVIYLVRVNLRKTATIANVLYALNAAATTPTANQNYVGVYNPSGTLLRASTAGVAETHNSYGLNPVPLSSSVAVSGVPWVWAAYLFNASSPANYMFLGFSGASGVWNGMGASAARLGTYGSGLTSLPSTITPASVNIFGLNNAWGAVS